MNPWKPDIFDYLDYRQYLRDYYEAAKAEDAKFSYRYFARRAGLNSPSFLRHVMRGERNIAGTLDNFVKALDLDEDEAEFFGHLVAFGQAESDQERSAAFEQLAALRRFRGARRIDAAMFDYLSHWYYPAIREMAARADFRAEPAWIAAELLPRITAEQAERALEVLLDLGLLVQRDDGTVGRGDTSVTTGHEVRSLAVANYHRQMLERAGAAIEAVPRDARDLAAMTVCIHPETAAEIKRRIHDFREIVLELCDRDDRPVVVYQFNSQLFPLSQISADDGAPDA